MLLPGGILDESASEREEREGGDGGDVGDDFFLRDQRDEGEVRVSMT